MNVGPRGDFSRLWTDFDAVYVGPGVILAVRGRILMRFFLFFYILQLFEIQSIKLRNSKISGREVLKTRKWRLPTNWSQSENIMDKFLFLKRTHMSIT